MTKQEALPKRVGLQNLTSQKYFVIHYCVMFTILSGDDLVVKLVALMSGVVPQLWRSGV